MTIFDISLPLNVETIIYPGNSKLDFKYFKSASGNFLSEVTFGSHTGTHIDAPSHAIEGSNSIDKIDLEIFVGTCRVLDLSKSKVSISVKDLENKNIQSGERILLKTCNSIRGFSEFYDDYIYLASDAAAFLAKINVKLVGIDFLSIKQRGSKDNRPHTELLSKNIPIIEGIDLSKVLEGEYELIALPLRFTGIDGSPARVVLLQN
jgi:arylformamidase